MLKYLLKPRNILILIAAVLLVVVIASQAGTLQSVIADYNAAQAESDVIAQKRVDVDERKDAAGETTDDEDAARADGYVSDDETVFIYGN